MASVCINNAGISPENGWLSPRLSFSRDSAVEAEKIGGGDDESEDFDFEFRLNDPVPMISADELFSDGKLVPFRRAPSQPAKLELKSARKEAATLSPPPPDQLYSFSPKAPRCSTVLKEFLRLKKAQTDIISQKSPSAKLSNSKSLKHLLRLNAARSLSVDSDADSISVSARASLSSSSSDDVVAPPLPLSLRRNASQGKAKLHSLRCGSESELEGMAAFRCLVESPRLNASGKVVFERSSSSPSICDGGARTRARGIERSRSANVIYTPVINVPGFGQLFSSLKKEKDASFLAKNGINGLNVGTKTKCEKLGARN